MAGLGVVALLCGVLGLAAGQAVVPLCGPNEPVCRVGLSVGHVMTMTYGRTKEEGAIVLIHANGSAVKRDGCDTYQPLPPSILREMNTADGTHKLAMGVNGSLPGPPIVVYEDTEVWVSVVNELLGEAVTIHFHGVHQRGTPWMDGAAQVSSCTIEPAETFVHRFRASPAGTHWYHAHSGTQRTEGVHGAFIVLPRTPDKAQKQEDGDFAMVLQDFYHRSSTELSLMSMWGVTKFSVSGYGDMDSACYSAMTSASADGAPSSPLPLDAILVNGRGQYFPPGWSAALNPGLPLETFHVRAGGRYRLRVINAALQNSLRVSVDGHTLEVVATDGAPVQLPASVDGVIVAAGESVDVVLTAGAASSWIRVSTLATNEPVHVEAVLRVVGDPGPPRSQPTPCLRDKPCVVLNCPYRYFPASDNTTCIPITDLHSPTVVKETVDREIFLNFRDAVQEPKFRVQPLINGNQHVVPHTPPQLYPPFPFAARVCGGPCPADKCACTHVVKLRLGEYVQIVLSIFDTVNDRFLMSHPAHIHGHTFEVVKVGFPPYDTRTGQRTGLSPDLTCRDKYCNDVTWADPTKAPALTSGPYVKKDTVAVPAGGYVVLRLKADNPGYWMMHCHMEFHQILGMALIFQAGEPEDMPALPTGFKTCGNMAYTWPPSSTKGSIETSNATQKLSGYAASGEAPMEGPMEAAGQGWQAAAGFLLVACVGLSIMCVHMYRKLQTERRQGYHVVRGEEEALVSR